MESSEERIDSLRFAGGEIEVVGEMVVASAPWSAKISFAACFS